MSSQKNRVLITGSTSGIGWHLAKIFAKNGHDVILSGRNSEKLEEISQIAKDFNVEVFKFECDLSDQKQIKNLSDFAIKNKVTMLINNAGLPCLGKSIGDASIDEINDLLNINFYAPIILTKLLYDYFLSLGHGNIININSMVGLEVKKFRTIYSAARWGLRGFTNSLIQEAKENNINVMSVYPTNVKTRPHHENAMDVEMVVSKIYEAFLQKKEELIIDGRIRNN